MITQTEYSISTGWSSPNGYECWTTVTFAEFIKAVRDNPKADVSLVQFCVEDKDYRDEIEIETEDDVYLVARLNLHFQKDKP